MFRLTELEAVLEIALDAVVAMDQSGIVVAWNAVAESTFGWTADEAIGRPMSELIVPPEYRDAHREGVERFNSTGEKRILDQRIEITGLHKDGRVFPVELAVTFAAGAEQKLFVGFLRDISARKRAEIILERQALEARLLFEVTRIAADTDSVEEAIRASLRAICQLTGWPVGHAFLVTNETPPELVSTNVWHEEAPGIAASIRAATAETRFLLGQGLPGTILETGAPAWIPDLANDAAFLRRGSGFGAAFGFPVKSEGRTIAVFEFFSREQMQPDRGLLLTVRTLGEQVGRVLDRKRTEEHQRLMTKELNHRVRNNLAIVQSIAHQTFNRETDRIALGSFESRVGALAAAHEVLTRENWESASLHDLVRQTLQACGAAEARTSIEGPELLLPPRIAVSVTMALHELCTNAVKYGAFSAEAGRVAVTWTVRIFENGQRFTLRWQESGGPRVTEPQRRGFGSRMIERALAKELGGRVELQFQSEGLQCIIDAPVPRGGENSELIESPSL